MEPNARRLVSGGVNRDGDFDISAARRPWVISYLAGNVLLAFLLVATYKLVYAVEARFFPCVTDFNIQGQDRTSDGHLLVWGSMVVGNCGKPRSVIAFTGEFDESPPFIQPLYLDWSGETYRVDPTKIVERLPGHQEWGPWRIQPPVPKGAEIVLTVRHPSRLLPETLPLQLARFTVDVE